MPRRRRAFIDRAKARTYEVVYRPLRDASGCERVFRVVERGNAAPTVDPAADSLAYEPEPQPELPYERDNFELGEYGFPDDGYDYSKHFKPIGGKGGVFIAAPSTEVAKPSTSNSLQLRDDVDDEPEEGVTTVMSGMDEMQRAQAIEEIKQARKQNPLFDEVFAALDSDGELQSDGEGPEDSDLDGLNEGNRAVLADEIGLEDDDAFPDDFVVLANAEEGSATLPVAVAKGTSEEVNTSRRRQRVLDDQFDQVMKTYEENESDEDDNGESNAAEWNEDDLSSTDADPDEELEVETGLNDAELQALLGSGGYTLDTEANEVTNDIASISLRGANDRINIFSGSFKPEEHAESQLHHAMDQLMDSYKRVSADDAFAAIDGLEVARRAIAEAEKCEKERLEDLNGAESDSADEELDAVLESMDDNREQWDCETIVSTYSNLDNHPSVIDDADATPRRRPRNLPPVIRLDRRTNLPVLSNPVGGPEVHENRDFGSRRPKGLPTGPRKKSETKEEKRVRKTAVKEAARARRVLKSEMKNAFAQEALVQNRHAASLGKSKVAVQL